LLRINQGLEQRVEEDKIEIIHNLKLLLVSQEALENLPVAVIGIGDDGLIAVANQMAHQLFGDGRPLLGEMANEVIPAELLNFIAARGSAKQENKKLCLTDGREFYCRYSAMGEISTSTGVILTCAPGS